MPLQTERPGVFRGRSFNREAWFVIDGDEPGVDDRVRAWRANFSPTNRPLWQRVGSVALFVGGGVVVLVAVSIAGGLVLTAIPDGGLRAGLTFPLFFVGLIAVIAGFFLGGALSEKAFPHVTPARGNVPGVHEVPEEVAEWATDQTDVQVISDLSRTLGRVRQSAMLLKFPADPIEDMDDSWVVEDVVAPVLREQLTALHAELVTVAERVGFPIPDLDLPPSPAE